MRKKSVKILNFILTGGLIAAFVSSDVWQPMTAQATTVSEIQGQINEHTGQLNAITGQLNSLETEQELLQEKIDDLNAEIMNTMAEIGMKEAEIANKEAEIANKEDEIAVKVNEISQKEEQIRQTEAEYDAAVEREEAQRESMAMCARLMYERSEETYLSAILEGKGFADILNRIDRVERVHEYENSVLMEYIDVKNLVGDLWDRLEEEKSVLESDREQLETDRDLLEWDREQLKADGALLQGQKADLDVMMAALRQESADYEAQIERARQQAAEARRLLEQDQERLRALQASQNVGNNSAAANINYATTDYTATIDGASGSDLGKKVAKYGCQYIGNPYVYGGTDLVNGADCSGFTYRVYADFGYRLSRTSYQQRNDGTGVSYGEAQPGDLICYDGHVGLYIGGGLIVHASNSNPYPSGGIKVTAAEYRPILAVRRIIN